MPPAVVVDVEFQNPSHDAKIAIAGKSTSAAQKSSLLSGLGSLHHHHIDDDSKGTAHRVADCWRYCWWCGGVHHVSFGVAQNTTAIYARQEGELLLLRLPG